MDKKTYTCGSHNPVIRSLMEVYKPTGIFELGCGLYSTPLFYSYNIPLLSIETNKEWIDLVIEKLEGRENFKVIHHPINLHVKTKYEKIDNKTINECIVFYLNYLDERFDCLFIDHISGLRSRVLLKFYKNFNYIIYHDAQHPDYFYKTPNDSNYFHIMFDKIVPWTGILIKKEFIDRKEIFLNYLNRYGKEYKKEFK